MSEKSVYTIRVISAAEKNAKVSPTFCLAKWKNSSMNLTSGHTHSCYHPPEHKIPLAELEVNYTALHNTEEKKAERALMMNGERPKGCSYCWNIEDSPGNHTSDRAYRTADVMDNFAHEEIISNLDPANFDVIPSYVEVNFSNVCNFKCSYCSPHLSNSWQKEIEKFGPYPTSVPHNSLDYFRQVGMMPIAVKDNNPYVDAFWKWWPDLYPQLKHFRMTGGEPLMDVNTHKVLNYIIENPKNDLHLALTTNLCSEKKLIDKFYSKVDLIIEGKGLSDLTLYVSCDAYGKRAEYIRNGMDFEYLANNSTTFLERFGSNKNVICTISYIMTINSLSITSLREFIDNIIINQRKKFNITDDWDFRNRVFFDTPMLNFPAWQSVQLLPKRYRDILRADIKYYKEKIIHEHNRMTADDYAQLRDFEVAKLERVLAWMEQGDNLPAEKIKYDRANFYKFFTEHDLRRETNFLEIFPEMKDFWELCEEAAND